MAPKKASSSRREEASRDPRLDVSFLLNQHSAPRRPPSAQVPTARRLQCTMCASTFAYEHDLNKHKRAVHDRVKSFQCDMCSKSFGEKGNLSKHRRSVHLNERPFVCPHCKKSFAFKDGVLRHINLVHLDQRPFVCNACGTGFKQVSQLRRHSANCNGHHAGSSATPSYASRR